MKIFVRLLLGLFPLTILCQVGSSAEYVCEVYHNISYYENTIQNDDKRKLDLYLPKGKKDCPIMIWIHGGAWAFGDKKQEKELAENFVEKGIAVAVIGYRSSPAIWNDPKLTNGIKHPEHIKDVAGAFKWVFNNANSYNYDKNSIFLGGFSSGAHLAALLSLNPKYLYDIGLSIQDIRGCIAIGGTYDLSHYYETIKNARGETLAKQHVFGVFGDKSKLTEASPISYVNNQWVPILAISDTQSLGYNEVFKEAASKAQNQKIILYNVEKNHKELYSEIAYSDFSPVRDTIESFINQNDNKYSYLNLESFKLAYRTFGTGPPLFLLNGGPGFSSHNFQKLARKLSENNTVVLFDQRGTGFSQVDVCNSQTITLDAMVEDMEALRKHLNYSKISVMGQSFGGMYAMLYTQKYPENINKLILSHSGGMTMSFRDEIGSRIRSRLDTENISLWNNSNRINDPNLAQISLAKGICSAYVYDKRYSNIVFKGLAYNSRQNRSVTSLVFNNLYEISYDVRSAMKKFDNQVLIIHGAQDIVNPNVAKFANDIFSNSELLILDKCGHYGWIEHPDKYYGSILDFLKS